MSVTGTAVTLLKQLLWDQVNGICGICLLPVLLDEMHIDHVQPRACGGSDEISNLQPAHPVCNFRKGDGIGVRPIKVKGHPSCTMDDPPLTVKEVATRIGLTEKTIRRWIHNGRFDAVRFSRRAGWRIPRAEVERIWRDSEYSPSSSDQ